MYLYTGNEGRGPGLSGKSFPWDEASFGYFLDTVVCRVTRY